MEFVILFIIYSFVITGLNIANCFRKKKLHEFFFDIFGTYPGLFMTIFAFELFAGIQGIMKTDYDKAVILGSYHTPLHSEYAWIIWTIVILGYIGLTVLGIFKPEKLPPLVSAFSIACTVLGIVAGIFLYIQLARNYEWLPFIFCLLYFANIILLAIRRIRYHITEHVRIAQERETAYRTKFGAWLGKVMSKISTMTLFSFALIFPIAAILEILSLIFGQGADGFIKAFTMTADWTFSTQIPPPPLEYDGHYLCTVAAGGHKKVVKPLRYGKRIGHYIVVNRQLLIANAFEDLIAEKIPKFHKAVRGFYNKYGYPISRHITTPLCADIVYIVMKPFEYIFVSVLYLFDSQPENRIAVQYSDYKRRD